MNEKNIFDDKYLVFFSLKSNKERREKQENEKYVQ
jgi:hypothetical protein